MPLIAPADATRGSFGYLPTWGAGRTDSNFLYFNRHFFIVYLNIKVSLLCRSFQNMNTHRRFFRTQSASAVFRQGQSGVFDLTFSGSAS